MTKRDWDAFAEWHSARYGYVPEPGGHESAIFGAAVVHARKTADADAAGMLAAVEAFAGERCPAETDAIEFVRAALDRYCARITNRIAAMEARAEELARVLANVEAAIGPESAASRRWRCACAGHETLTVERAEAAEDPLGRLCLPPEQAWHGRGDPMLTVG